MQEGEGKCILAASLATQEAYGKKEQDHSIFTYHLLEGLRGANDASIDKDGYVTPSSLGDYVYERVTTSAIKQKPVIKTETAGKILFETWLSLAVNIPTGNCCTATRGCS